MAHARPAPAAEAWAPRCRQCGGPSEVTAEVAEVRDTTLVVEVWARCACGWQGSIHQVRAERACPACRRGAPLVESRATPPVRGRGTFYVWQHCGARCGWRSAEQALSFPALRLPA